MAIRTRILLVVIALVLGALSILDVVSYTVVRSSLISRADAQLQAAAPQFTSALNALLLTGQTSGTDCYGLPLHSFSAVYRLSGSPAGLSETCPSESAVPHTPVSIVRAEGKSAVPLYVTQGSYRLVAEQVRFRPRPTGFGPAHSYNLVLVVGEPIAPVRSTLSDVLLLELIVTGSIVLAAGAAAFFLVQLGLRPLEKMSETADEIAAGDLSRRVEVSDEHTEVGRLGVALNTMLGRIEAAFQDKEVSEARLRRFVADASHELRTPLTSIRGYAELFRHRSAAGGREDQDLATAMRRIESESERMSGLVEDLLLLARLDQGRPLDQAPVDLLTIARDAVADAQVIAPDREITVESSTSEDVADFVAAGDGERLSQVLVNLLSNAVAHTPDGSPIEVRVTGTAATVRIEVVDHGPGIAAEERARVFDRFWRADSSRQRRKGSTGLGLSIVAAVVAAHRGSVFVWETTGGGASFGVELPRAGIGVDEAATLGDSVGALGGGADGAGAWMPSTLVGRDSEVLVGDVPVGDLPVGDVPAGDGELAVVVREPGVRQE